MAMDESGLAGESAAGHRTKRVPVAWTSDMRSDFLDHLAATCNVAESARSIGVDPRSVYNLRRKEKRFRNAWLLAIESGYEMLETQLIGHALGGGGAQLTNGDVATTGPIDVVLAQTLLTAHRGRRADAFEKGGPRYKTVTPEQTDASILRKLKAMERGRKRTA